MNKKTYRLVYSRLRGMVVAVEETATAAGKTESGESRASRRSLGGSGLLIADGIWFFSEVCPAGIGWIDQDGNVYWA